MDYVKKYAGGRLCANLTAVHPEKRRVFGFLGSAKELAVHDDLFDECRSAGVLHHLPTESAKTAIREMHRSVRRGGRLVIFDNVMPRSGFIRPLAWLMRKFDRGEWGRDEEQLLSLVHSAGEKDWTSIRFTYSYYGLEGMIFVSVKR
jgi:ubiquinone/menaquinone biosynthesis C-methylase UbiE